VTNPDRTARNPNLLVWQRRPWLIDHGAALYAHHDWASVDEARARTPFPLVKQHVLLARSGDIAAVDEAMAARLGEDVVAGVLAQVPDALLVPEGSAEFPSAEAARARYRAYFAARLRAPRAFVDEAVQARARLLADPPRRLSSRR
jgi:hypothetical protein